MLPSRTARRCLLLSMLLAGALLPPAQAVPRHKAKAAAQRAADVAEDERDRSVALHELGDVLVAQGDLAGARTLIQESLDIFERLATADFSSAALQHDLSVSLTTLGRVLVRQGDLAGARLGDVQCPARREAGVWK